jgi:uncharacterized protein (DUF362 family)
MPVYAAKLSPQASSHTVKDVLSRHLRLLSANTTGLRDKKVLVVPNLCGPGSLSHEYSMTSRDMIVACVRSARESGAATVAVANHAADYVADTHAFYDALGIFDLARHEGFAFHDLRHESFTQDRDLRLAGVLDFADVILNVTLPKTHHQADGVSLTLKSLGMGLTAGRERLMHQHDLSAAIVAANIAVRQRVTVLDIIDGRRGQQGMGPHFGRPVDHGFILTGNDPVGVDATAARLMGFDPFLIRTLLLARQAGLGTLEPEVLGDIATIPTINYERSPNWSFQSMSDDRMAVFHLEKDGLGTVRFYRLNGQEQRYEPIKAQTKTVSFCPDTSVSEAEGFVFAKGMLETIFRSRDVVVFNNNLQFVQTSVSAPPLGPARDSLPDKTLARLGSWLDSRKLAQKDDLTVRVDDSGLLYNEPPANDYGVGQEVFIPRSHDLAEFLRNNNVRSFIIRRGTQGNRLIACFEARFLA